MIRARRNEKGNQISEFGPAIFLLIIAILIPMMICIYIGFGYACGWYLNFMSVRAVAVTQKSQVQAACDRQTAGWYASGLPAFTRATVISNTGSRISTDDDTATGSPVDLDDYARVTTVVRITPFVQLPWLGINSFTFTYTGERPIEEYDPES